MVDIKVALKKINSSLEKENKKSVAFLSVDKGLGQGTFIANLAMMYAHENEKTLILDIDNRHNVFSPTFGLQSGKGIFEYLSTDEADTKNYLNEVGNDGLLTVFTSGEGVSENEVLGLLGSTKFSKLYAEFSDEYDHILINVQPNANIKNVLPALEMSDGTILTATMGSSNKRSVHMLMKQLKLHDLSIIGYVNVKRS